MGTTIGNVLVSYDVNTGHEQVKRHLEELGYRGYWFFQPNPATTYELPNTTLIHMAKSTDIAMMELRTACLQSGAILLRAITVLVNEPVGYIPPR